jgi:hypothetical protein
MTGQQQALFLCLARWRYAGYVQDYLESVKLTTGGATSILGDLLSPEASHFR